MFVKLLTEANRSYDELIASHVPVKKQAFGERQLSLVLIAAILPN